MIFQGLALAASDLIGALLVLGAVSLACWLIAREERKLGEETELFSEAVDRLEARLVREDWNFPPKWDGAPAESRLGKTRIGVDREAA